MLKSFWICSDCLEADHLADELTRSSASSEFSYCSACEKYNQPGGDSVELNVEYTGETCECRYECNPGNGNYHYSHYRVV